MEPIYFSETPVTTHKTACNCNPKSIFYILTAVITSDVIQMYDMLVALRVQMEIIIIINNNNYF